MSEVQNVPFSAFLAGVLLVKKNITNMEFSILCSDFEQKMNVVFMSEAEDFNLSKLNKFYYLSADGIHLNGDYGDKVNIDNKKYSFYECLYGFTNQVVRSYFSNLPPVYDPNYVFNIDVLANRKR